MSEFLLNIPPFLRAVFIAGACVYFICILWMLRKGKLNIQYSILWLASAVAVLVFSCFPYVLAVLSDIFEIEVIANLVFILLFIFVLLLLLSLSIIVTGFADKIKRLTQTQALLEKRIRELEGTPDKREETNSRTDNIV